MLYKKSNYERFPENVLATQEMEIGTHHAKLFRYRFKGLQDFYDFLKSNPSINKRVWPRDEMLSSIEGSESFAGRPYEEALQRLVSEVDPGYQEYLRVQNAIRAKLGKTHEYQTIKTVAGGRVDPVAYTTGSPTIYRANRLLSKPKFITIDTQVAYYHGTTKKQVFNRAVIITNLIHALEKKGYNVDVNSFMMVEDYHVDDEYIQAIFEVKKHGQRTNYQTLYKSLVDVEFFRRLCFRLIEISDVKRNWPDGYGRTCDKDEVKRILNLGKEDIYFDQPRDMGIRGKDIGDDFENTIHYLNLQNIIDVETEKKVLRESVKVLTR